MIGVRPTMEDAVVMEKDFMIAESGGRKAARSMALFAVFDGHGGAQCADYLSRHAASVLAKHLAKEDGSGDVSQCLEDAINELDEACIEHSADGSGSTGVIVLLDKRQRSLWVTNVGDSRCILLSSDGVTQLSVEHKPTDPDERQRIMEAEGWVAYGRVMGILAVSRSFGDRDFKRHSSGLVIVRPSITHHRLTAKDEYLVVACDGLFDVFSNEDVQKFINFANELYPDLTLDQLATDIVTAAIKERHSRDNVSTILIKLYVDGADEGDSRGASLADAASEAKSSSARTAADESSAPATESGSTDVASATSRGGAATERRSTRERRRVGRSMSSDDDADAVDAVSGAGGGSAVDATVALLGLDITPSAIGGVVRGGRR